MYTAKEGYKHEMEDNRKEVKDLKSKKDMKQTNGYTK